MKPYATIQLHTCYGCGCICGPKAGKFVRLDQYVKVGNKMTKTVFVCYECLEKIAKTRS